MSTDKSPITSHILNTTTGLPAVNVTVELHRKDEDNSEWLFIGKGKTDGDGRVNQLLPPGTPLTKGTYKAIFFTKDYFDRDKLDTFYPYVEIIFLHDSDSDSDHYHIPLLISPFGYSTYRGS